MLLKDAGQERPQIWGWNGGGTHVCVPKGTKLYKSLRMSILLPWGLRCRCAT